MQLVYFAWVRERIGKSEEQLSLPDDVKTVADLLAHLCAIDEGYLSALNEPAKLRFAVNQAHVGPDHPVTDADELAIFPPVTGG